MTNKKIPTVEELWDQYLHSQKSLPEDFCEIVHPILDRLAEAEKPRTNLTLERLEEHWRAGNWRDGLSRDELQAVLWPIIQFHAVVPEGYVKFGDRFRSNRNADVAWVALLDADDCEHDPRNFHPEPESKRQRTNREKVLALHNLPDPTAISTALLRVAEGETLDALCAEFGVALEVEEV